MFRLRIFGLVFSLLLVCQPCEAQMNQEKARQSIEAEGLEFTEQDFVDNAHNGNLEDVELYLLAGMSPNAKDNYGITALMEAASNGHTEVVKVLLEAGADVNAKDNYSITALIEAASNGHTESVKVLLAAGADVNAKFDDGKTALTWGAEEGHTEVVKVLLEAGADVNAKDTNGWTGLMIAARFGHTVLMKVLLEAGADVNAKDTNGWTAMMWATNRSHTETMKVLLEAGADVNTKDDFCGLFEKVARGEAIQEGYKAGHLFSEQYRILRNAAYARHGRHFKSGDLQDFFYGSDSEPCGMTFGPNETYSDEMVTKIDRANIERILNLEREQSKAESQRWIHDFQLPTRIAVIEEKLGPPKKVEVPDPEDPSPWGQWFTWELHKGQVKLVALASDSSQRPDHNAEVHYIKLTMNNSTFIQKTIYGLALNWTQQIEIEDRFEQMAQSSSEYEIYSGRDELVFQLEIASDIFWNYLRFRSDGTLMEVVQSTFNLVGAD